MLDLFELLSRKDRVSVAVRAAVVLGLILTACGPRSNQSDVSPAVATNFAVAKQVTPAPTPPPSDVLSSCPIPGEGDTFIYQGIKLTIVGGRVVFTNSKNQQVPLSEREEEGDRRVLLPEYLGLSELARTVAIIKRDWEGHLTDFRVIDSKTTCPGKP